MGFHDVEWAYSIDRPLAETAVLAALCHRTDDATHETFVGQQAVAEMIGSSPEKVMRALSALEAAGVITRRRRNDSRGYRTSDLITVNVDSYVTDRLPGDSPTRRISYQENRRGLGDFSSPPTRRKVTAIDQPEDQPEEKPDHSSSPAATAIESEFDRVWQQWPKKVEKKASQAAFVRAAKNRGVEALVADIFRFARAYATTTEKRYVPALRVWLRGERWTDDLPSSPPPTEAQWQGLLDSAPPRAGRLTPTQRALQTMEAGRQVAERTAAACDHRWLPDGTCNFCTARQPELEAGAA